MVTVRELVKLLNTKDNMTGGTGKERILGIHINDRYLGYITSAGLDGWGDGLVTDVSLYITTDITDNARKIRSMTNEELAENRIDRIDIYCKSDTQMWVGDFAGIAESKEEALRLEMEWLQNKPD